MEMRKITKSAKTSIVHYAAVLTLLISASTNAAIPAELFRDDFTDPPLDTSLWSVVVDGNGQSHAPYVADGLLHSQGYHTRIDTTSFSTFEPVDQIVTARARIRLAGEYNKFGFAVNPGGRPDPITGYYFDTLDVEVLEDHVRALASSNQGSGSMSELLNDEISVTWNEFHEFAIDRTPSQVIFSIDGQVVTYVADAFADPLPVGVWNDRGSLMQTDWVDVISVPLMPGDVNFDGFVGGDDLSTITTNWGREGMSRKEGDLSGDGFVTGHDYTEVLTYWGTGTPPEEATSIPEPATLGLLLLGGQALLRRRRLN